MSRLVWNALGERFYETGISRGVFYPMTGPGVAWSGITSVKEAPTGGTAEPYYIDGVKYLNVATAEEFEAVIEAYGAPLEFRECDGQGYLGNGLTVTQQPRRPFGFSYQTIVGNDSLGLEHGRKIHLVYNALAAPTNRDYNTLGEDAEAQQLSWRITVTPPLLPGIRPSGHFTVDSRLTPPDIMAALEDQLYGTPTQQALLPTPADLVALFAPSA